MPATIAFMMAMNDVVRYPLKSNPKTIAASGSQIDEIKQNLRACHLLSVRSPFWVTPLRTDIDWQRDCNSLRNVVNSDRNSHNKPSSCAMEKIIPRKYGGRLHVTNTYHCRIKDNEALRKVVKRNAQSSN